MPLILPEFEESNSAISDLVRTVVLQEELTTIRQQPPEPNTRANETRYLAQTRV